MIVLCNNEWGGDASVVSIPSLFEGFFEGCFSLVPLGLEVLNG